MKFEDPDLQTPSNAAFYLWDYFYILNYPTDAERRAWRRIECATIRIRESEPFLREGYPAPVRVRNAKRVRRAIREIVRLSTEKLETLPERRVATALGLLGGHAQRIIDTLAEEAEANPLH